MRRRIVPFILAGALSIAAVVPAAAAPPPQRNAQLGGAAGLVAVVAQVAANVGIDDIEIANNSLNNLLRNADIDVLNNILNNSLNDLTITVERNLNNNDVVVSVLSGGIATGDLITVTP